MQACSGWTRKPSARAPCGSVQTSRDTSRLRPMAAQPAGEDRRAAIAASADTRSRATGTASATAHSAGAIIAGSTCAASVNVWRVTPFRLDLRHLRGTSSRWRVTMPHAALPPCRDPRCTALGRGGWCDSHRPAPRIAQREKSVARGYTHEWRKLRDSIMRHRPVCACGAIATDLDHIVPIRAGGTHALSNLRPMCKPCHSRKTIARDGGYGRARV